MSLALMTIDDLKQTLPKGLQYQSNQAFADTVNSTVADPDTAWEVRGNFITCAKGLQEGNYKSEDYLNPVTYCTFTIMRDTNSDSYAKTFPARYNTLVLRGCHRPGRQCLMSPRITRKSDQSDLGPGRHPDLVVEMGCVPTSDQHPAGFDGGPSVNSRVRAAAANSLLTYLNPPEANKVELDISVKNQEVTAGLMATMEQMIQQKLELISRGASVKEMGSAPLMIEVEAHDVASAPYVRSQWAPAEFIPKSEPDPELLVPVNSFARLEDIRAGGDFFYAEDVMVPWQKTFAMTLLPESADAWVRWPSMPWPRLFGPQSAAHIRRARGGVRAVKTDVQAGLNAGDTSEFIRDRGRQESKHEAGQQHHKIGPEHERQGDAKDRGGAGPR